MICILLIAVVCIFDSIKSQEQHPKLSIDCNDLAKKNQPCVLRFHGNSNETVIAEPDQLYWVTCTAKYLVKYDVSILEEKLSGFYLTRNVENIFNISTYEYSLQYYFSTSLSSTGSVTCKSVDNPQLYSTLQFFTQSSKFFPKSGEIINITAPTDSSVVPCPSNYADLIPILQHRNTDQESFRSIKWQYDPKTGFIAEKNRTLKGEFKCSSPISPSDFVLIRFGQKDAGADTADDFDANPKLSFRPASTSLRCNEYDDKKLKGLIDIRCTYPDECDLYSQYGQTGERSGEISTGKHCLLGNCITVEHAQPVGYAVCQSGMTKVSDYHFVGLDRKNYLLSEGSFPERALIFMGEVNPALYVDEPAHFYCQALGYLFSETLQFSVVYKNGTQASLPSGTFKAYDGDELSSTDAFGAIQSGVHVNLTADMTEIVCHAPWYNSSTAWFTKSRKFTALDVKAPSIVKSNSTNLFYIGDRGRTLNCKAEGAPPPTFKWFRNGSEIFSPADGSTFSIARSETESVLQFPELSQDFQGTYECLASNRVGNDSFTFNLEVRESSISPIAIGLVTVGLAVISCVILVFFCRMRKKYLDAKTKLRNLTEEEIEEFEKGNPEILAGKDVDLQENAQFLPFDENYKLSDQDVVMDKSSILGKGAYGMVFRGTYLGDPVAIKTTLPSAEVSYFKALLAELKVMAYIGSHPNVVKFIGAVTSRIRERTVFVILEMSPLGNMESYLKSHRTTYVNLLVDDRIVKTELQYQNVIKRVTTFDFVSWCHQIAAGMQYLASKKVIHGDLAARNILLFHGDVAKITDFGLSRQIYENTNYTKKNLAPLPWRWMAIESLRDLEFSSKSDVWAYAVTAWEIFTMAEVPFPGLCWSMDFIEQLEAGLRMHKPKFATEEIYAMLARCWDPQPDDRPTFEELKDFFGTLTETFQGGSVSINLERAIYSNYCG